MVSEAMLGILIIIGMLIILFFSITMIVLSEISHEIKRLDKNDEKIRDELHQVRMDFIKYKG